MQVDLAVALGDRYDQTMVSHVEAGRSDLLLDGAVKAARELKISLDYLVGLTDDPTPAADRSAAPDDLTDVNTLESSGRSNTRPVEIYDLSIAAGGGALVDAEKKGESMWFRRDWLDRHGLDPTQCSVFHVRGESMEETLPDGCSILVDRNQTRRRVGHIYVVRTEDGLIVKRLRKDEDGNWLLVSDHPRWKPLPWPHTAEVIGEVKWVAKTL